MVRSDHLEDVLGAAALLGLGMGGYGERAMRSPAALGLPLSRRKTWQLVRLGRKGPWAWRWDNPKYRETIFMTDKRGRRLKFRTKSAACAELVRRQGGPHQ